VRTTFVALAAIALLTLPKLSAAAPAPAADTARFATWNMYGNVGHHGNEHDWEPPGFEAEIRDRFPGTYVGIALQEVCHNLGQRVAEIKGMAMEFIHTGPHCDNGAQYGNAVLYQPGSGTGRVARWMLPNPLGKENRGVVAVSVRVTPTWVVMFGSTHLSLEAENRAAQVKWLVEHELHSDPNAPSDQWPMWVSGTAVLCGDFNSKPADKVMDPMYEQLHAQEPYARKGPATHDDGRKIDYMFSWDMRGTAPWTNPNVSATPNSDHHRYEATLTW
jgi:endonuclease/exonuclease/phosphatase family metal-dependent hydrolase